MQLWEIFKALLALFLFLTSMKLASHLSASNSLKEVLETSQIVLEIAFSIVLSIKLPEIEH